MKKRNIIYAATILFVKQVSLAQNVMLFDVQSVVQRVNVNYSVAAKSYEGSGLNPNDLNSILSSLKTKGVYADHNSEINVHQEDNYIDISCFNCLVVSVESGYIIEGSHNKDVPSPE